MKSRVSQKFAKRIREFDLVFKPQKDSPDNTIWEAKNYKNSNLILEKHKNKDTELVTWTCKLADREYTDDYVSFHHQTTEEAVCDCLTQLYDWLLAEVRFYGKKLGKIDI